MKTKHTPGPWRPVKDAQGICGLMHPRKKGVAVAWFSSTFLPANGYVGEKESTLGCPERQANARLIAAAPELLEALETVIASAHPHPTDNKSMYAAWEKAKAAITKAKEETP